MGANEGRGDAQAPPGREPRERPVVRRLEESLELRALGNRLDLRESPAMEAYKRTVVTERVYPRDKSLFDRFATTEGMGTDEATREALRVDLARILGVGQPAGNQKEWDAGAPPMVEADLTVFSAQWLRGKCFCVEGFLDQFMLGERWTLETIPRKVANLHHAALMVAMAMIQTNTLRGWAVALALPTMCLQRYMGFTEKGKHMRDLAMRLIRYVRGDFATLLEEGLHRMSTNAVEWKASMRREALLAAELGQGASSGWTKEVGRKVMQGKLKGAMKEMVLNGGDIHKHLKERDMEILRAKLRPDLDTRPSEEAMRHLREVARQSLVAKQKELKDFTVEEMLKCFAEMDPTSGPGFSGHRYSHFRSALTAVARRDPMVKAFAAVCSAIKDGLVPEELVPYVTGGRGGISGEQRVFIAMEPFARMAERMLNSHEQAEWRKEGSASPFKCNIGIGVPGPLDSLAEYAEKALDGVEPQHRPHMVFFGADAVNMFFNISRVWILEIIAREAPEYFGLASYLFHPQFVTMFKGTLVAALCNGVVIGGPSAGFEACLGAETIMRTVMRSQGWKDQCERVRPGMPLAAPVVYIDNLVAVVHAEYVVPLKNLLEVAGAPGGYSFEGRPQNPTSVHFLNGGTAEVQGEIVRQYRRTVFQGPLFVVSTPIEGVLDPCDMEGKAILPQGQKFAGVLVGSEQYRREQLERHLVKATDRLRVLVQHKVHPMACVQLLKKCVLPAVEATLRWIPSSPEVRGRLEGFDAEVLRMVGQKMEGNPQDFVSQDWEVPRVQNPVFVQMGLPASEGGFGIHAMSLVHPVARLASKIQAQRIGWVHGAQLSRLQRVREEELGQEVRSHINKYNELCTTPAKHLPLDKGLTGLKAAVAALPDGKRRPQKAMATSMASSRADTNWYNMESVIPRYAAVGNEEFLKKIKIQVAALSQPGFMSALGATWMVEGVLPEMDLSEEGKAKMRRAEFHLSPSHYAYLFRRATVSKDPHALNHLLKDLTDTEREEALRCGHRFAMGGECAEESDLGGEHSEARCRGRRGAAKHSSMEYALAVLMEQAGYRVKRSGTIVGEKKHGDLTVGGTSHVYLETVFDVTNRVLDKSRVADKGTPRSKSVDVRPSLAAAEASKRLKYEEICTDRSLGFVPFAMSVWGTLGEATGPVIELVTDSLVERLMMAKSVVTYRVRSFLVGSVMRQIATNGVEALARIRSKALRAVARRVVVR